MTTDATSDGHDPYTWLLMFLREARRQGAALQGSGSAAALTFFQEQLPGYQQVLEQALFPLLKRRLRDDDDAAEETLRQTLFLASGNLRACLEPLAAVTSPPPGTTTTHALLTSFLHHLDLHLEKMDTVILPAVPTRLGECDIALLASSLRRHPVRSPCPSTHSRENVPDAR